MKKNIFYIAIVSIFFLALNFYLKIPKPNTHIKCPEEYTEDDIGTAEYKDALSNWTSVFLKTHPEATISEWSEAKSKMWSDNNCLVAIERSKMSGKVADLKPWERVDYAMQNAIQNTIYEK
ncbi:MAG: hypothetical protein WCT07_04680 [Candidatus Paceibacterota bacterium]|jgi:hypothetical protein